MHVFHIKGLSGIVLLLAAVLTALLLLIGLPSVFMMVLWNALVFETFGGPEINLYQGLLLWLMTAIALKLIFNPEVHFEFHKVQEPPSDKPLDKLDKKEGKG